MLAGHRKTERSRFPVFCSLFPFPVPDTRVPVSRFSTFGRARPRFSRKKQQRIALGATAIRTRGLGPGNGIGDHKRGTEIVFRWAGQDAAAHVRTSLLPVFLWFLLSFQTRTNRVAIRLSGTKCHCTLGQDGRALMRFASYFIDVLLVPSRRSSISMKR